MTNFRSAIAQWSAAAAMTVCIAASSAFAATSEATKLERECNFGGMRSCVDLGVLYRHGTGVRQDDVKAFSLYQRACGGGYEFACGYVGDMMYRGLGTRQNKIEGERLLRQGCRDGNNWTCRAVRRYGLEQ